MTLLVALLLAAPAAAYDSFDGALDARLWYIGVARPPKGGALRLPRDGWIAARAVPDPGPTLVEVEFTGRGGVLEVAFHSRQEPLSRPLGPSLSIPRTRGGRTRLLRIGPTGASVDGEPLPWKGPPGAVFRLWARRGEIDLEEVRVTPAAASVAEPTPWEARTVFLSTTPETYRDATGVYRRETLALWDVEVCFLLRRGAGPSGFELLRGVPKGAPTLAALVTLGDGRELAKKASSHPLAARDWGDERRNLDAGEFRAYLAGQYTLFDLLGLAQRALNAAAPDRGDLEPLLHLAVIRHAANARAAVALAETLGGKKALAALERALEGADPARVTGDRLRLAAGKAAREILGAEPPPDWPGFRFDPQNRFLTMDRARELSR